MGLHQHIGDDRLFDAYLAHQVGDQVDPSVGGHLADCAACTGRYEDLAAFMEGVRADADEDVDTVFPGEWLRQQQGKIARRLEQAGHAARVITFPHHADPPPAIRRSLPIGPRWIAVAAAAGLFIGAAVGTLYTASWRPVAPEASVSRGAEPSEPVLLAMPVASQPNHPPLDDDTFLSELELAVDGPRCRELQAFDALTPAVSDAQVVRISY